MNITFKGAIVTIKTYNNGVGTVEEETQMCQQRILTRAMICFIRNLNTSYLGYACIFQKIVQVLSIVIIRIHLCCEVFLTYILHIQ